MNRILVTGAAGFIGSHLTEALARAGCEVRAMVHYNFQNNWGWLDTLHDDVMAQVEVFPADICDAFAVRKAVQGCDLVYHLAALIAVPYSYRAPAAFVETNVKGTLNVLQACLDECTPRLVHTSTSETYGSAQYVPIDERHPLVGQSPYAASKIGADKLVEAYRCSFDLPVAVVRPFNTFGPRQSARAVIPTIIAQALTRSERVRLGSLTPVRDYNYVEDTVRGFMLAGKTDSAIGRVVNLGSGDGISVGDLARLILELCGSDAAIETESARLRPPKSEVTELVCDSRLALELLGWKSRISLREGLEATAAWMENNMVRYKPTIFNR